MDPKGQKLDNEQISLANPFESLESAYDSLRTYTTQASDTNLVQNMGQNGLNLNLPLEDGFEAKLAAPDHNFPSQNPTSSEFDAQDLVSQAAIDLFRLNNQQFHNPEASMISSASLQSANLFPSNNLTPQMCDRNAKILNSVESALAFFPNGESGGISGVFSPKVATSAAASPFVDYNASLQMLNMRGTNPFLTTHLNHHNPFKNLNQEMGNFGFNGFYAGSGMNLPTLKGLEAVQVENSSCFDPSKVFEGEQSVGAKVSEATANDFVILKGNGAKIKRVGPRSSGRKRCEASGCQITANYGTPGGSARYCSTHRPPEMKLLYAKFCEVPNCGRRAIFREEGGLLSKCREHKKEGMTTSQKLCGHHGCPTQARFGRPNETQRWCNAHKKDGMVRMSKGLYGGDRRKRHYSETYSNFNYLPSTSTTVRGSQSQIFPSNKLNIIPKKCVEISTAASNVADEAKATFSALISSAEKIVVDGCPLEHLVGKLSRMRDQGLISEEQFEAETRQAVVAYRDRVYSASVAPSGGK
mmetsp:Transcript_7983/g.12107  ORF Transcript_7983/g.12107 Transcript_7983/m.12107 type:complete len:528 (+) Transcript_7983:282-1865(+)